MAGFAKLNGRPARYYDDVMPTVVDPAKELATRRRRARDRRNHARWQDTGKTPEAMRQAGKIDAAAFYCWAQLGLPPTTQNALAAPWRALMRKRARGEISAAGARFFDYAYSHARLRFLRGDLMLNHYRHLMHYAAAIAANNPPPAPGCPAYGKRREIDKWLSVSCRFVPPPNAGDPRKPPLSFLLSGIDPTLETYNHD